MARPFSTPSTGIHKPKVTGKGACVSNPYNRIWFQNLALPENNRRSEQQSKWQADIYNVGCDRDIDRTAMAAGAIIGWSRLHSSAVTSETHFLLDLLGTPQYNPEKHKPPALIIRAICKPSHQKPYLCCKLSDERAHEGSEKPGRDRQGPVMQQIPEKLSKKTLRLDA